jgi:Protein of unknown function (DUF1501)
LKRFRETPVEPGAGVELSCCSWFRLQVYDIHATILHLLGIDHTKLTFRHNGIDRRLTDVHGHVIKELLA